MNAFSVLQDEGDASSSEEEPTPTPVEQKEAPTANGGSKTSKTAEGGGDKEGGDKEAAEKKAEKEAEEAKSISFAEYEAQKAAQKAAVANGLGKKTKARKANDGGDAFGKMQAHKKADVDAIDGEVDASSLLSAVQIKEMPAVKGLKDSTHQAVQDAHKIQSFFNEPPRGGGRGGRGRGGFRGGGGGDRGGGDRGGRGGSSDARRSNYSGHGAPQRDFRDQRQFNRDGDDNSGGGRGGRGDSNGYRGRGGGRGGGRGDRGGYQRRDNYQSGPRHAPATVGAPNVDDQSAFPSLG